MDPDAVARGFHCQVTHETDDGCTCGADHGLPGCGKTSCVGYEGDQRAAALLEVRVGGVGQPLEPRGGVTLSSRPQTMQVGMAKRFDTDAAAAMEARLLGRIQDLALEQKELRGRIRNLEKVNQ